MALECDQYTQSKKLYEFIQEKVDQRRDGLIESQNLGIRVKLEFADLFAELKAVSTMKDKSHFLTRMSKAN